MAEVVLHKNGQLSVEGSITIDNVVTVAERGVALFNSGDLVIDMARVAEVDSTAVSMLLEWRREANRRNCQLSFINIPQKLQSLVQLYGVAELMRLSIIRTGRHRFRHTAYHERAFPITRGGPRRHEDGCIAAVDQDHPILFSP